MTCKILHVFNEFYMFYENLHVFNEFYLSTTLDDMVEGCRQPSTTNKISHGPMPEESSFVAAARESIPGPKVRLSTATARGRGRSSKTTNSRGGRGAGQGSGRGAGHKGRFKKKDILKLLLQILMQHRNNIGLGAQEGTTTRLDLVVATTSCLEMKDSRVNKSLI